MCAEAQTPQKWNPLREYLANANMTQEQASGALKVSLYTYVSWENGRRMPQHDNKRRIDALLGEGE